MTTAATLAAQNIIDTPSREAVITAMTPMLIYILPIYMVVYCSAGCMRSCGNTPACGFGPAALPFRACYRLYYAV